MLLTSKEAQKLNKNYRLWEAGLSLHGPAAVLEELSRINHWFYTGKD